MKKLLSTILAFASISAAVYAQGNINLTNPNSTQPINIAAGGFLGAAGAMPIRGTSVFIAALLVDGSSTPFIYKTNSAALTGTISAGSSIAYADNLTHSFQVVVWSAALGSTYANMLANIGGSLSQTPVVTSAPLAGQYVGYSSVGSFSAVASPGTPANLFGTGAGQVSGFTLNATTIASPVPEPGTMALAALGGASLLLFRRKK